MDVVLRPMANAWGFLKRHKRKVLYGTAVTAAVGGFVAYRKFKPMIDELRAQIKMIKQLDAQMNNKAAELQGQRKVLQERLEHNMRVGDVTLKNFCVGIKSELEATFDIDELRKNMKKSADSKQSRSSSDLNQWDTFKQYGFARAITAVYSVCLLNLIIKVQQSIVSRYMCVEAGQPEAAKLASANANKVFLGFSEHTQKQGLSLMCVDMLLAVRGVLKKWSLKAPCTKVDIEQCVSEIRKAFEPGLWKSAYVLPAAEQIERDVAALPQVEAPAPVAEDPEAPPGLPEAPPPPAPRSSADTVREMVEETRSIIATESFAKVYQESLDRAFARIALDLESAWVIKGKAKKQVPFATAMIKFTKMYSLLLPNDLDNSLLLQQLEGQDSVRSLCSVIFYPLEVTTAEDIGEEVPAAGADEMQKLLQMMMGSEEGAALKQLGGLDGLPALEENTDQSA